MFNWIKKLFVPSKKADDIEEAIVCRHCDRPDEGQPFLHVPTQRGDGSVEYACRECHETHLALCASIWNSLAKKHNPEFDKAVVDKIMKRTK